MSYRALVQAGEGCDVLNDTCPARPAAALVYGVCVAVWCQLIGMNCFFYALPVAPEMLRHIVDDIESKDLRVAAEVVRVFYEFGLLARARVRKWSRRKYRLDKFRRLAVLFVIRRHSDDIRERTVGVELRGRNAQKFGRAQNDEMRKFLLKTLRCPRLKCRLDHRDLAPADKRKTLFDAGDVKTFRGRRSRYADEYDIAILYLVFIHAVWLLKGIADDRESAFLEIVGVTPSYI